MSFAERIEFGSNTWLGVTEWAASKREQKRRLLEEAACSERDGMFLRGYLQCLKDMEGLPEVPPVVKVGDPDY